MWKDRWVSSQARISRTLDKNLTKICHNGIQRDSQKILEELENREEKEDLEKEGSKEE